MASDDTTRWTLTCPKCGHTEIRWINCYAAERLTIRPIGIRIECYKCLHQGPICPDKTAAVKAWAEARG